MFFKKKDKELDLLKKEIYGKAARLAEESFRKEVEFRELTSTNLNYNIISDLVKAAKLTGKVEIRLKDGSVVTISDTTVVSDRTALNSQSEQLY